MSLAVLELALSTRLAWKVRDLPAFASQMLGLKACAIMPGLILFILFIFVILRIQARALFVVRHVFGSYIPRLLPYTLHHLQGYMNIDHVAYTVVSAELQDKHTQVCVSTHKVRTTK